MNNMYRSSVNDTYQTSTDCATNGNHLKMARLQTTLQLHRSALLDIIIMASRHRRAVDERRALFVPDGRGGFLFEVGHVARSRARPKIQVKPQLKRFKGNKVCRKAWSAMGSDVNKRKSLEVACKKTPLSYRSDVSKDRRARSNI